MSQPLHTQTPLAYFEGFDVTFPPFCTGAFVPVFGAPSFSDAVNLPAAVSVDDVGFFGASHTPAAACNCKPDRQNTHPHNLHEPLLQELSQRKSLHSKIRKKSPRLASETWATYGHPYDL
jgi:hypothetical protein